MQVLVLANNKDKNFYQNSMADGYIFPLKDYSMDYEVKFTLEEIESLRNINKKCFIIINRMFFESDLDNLDKILSKIDTMNIDGILYYDDALLELKIENNYNMAFFQLVDYVQDVEVYLAKSVISNSPESGAETLTYIWREANLAQTYLSMLPMNSVELENTAKFLNQVSDYSYSLSRKTINNTQLSQEDLDNLDKLHDYSLQLENTLNQLSLDINDGRITWGELTNKAAPAFAKQVSNISQDSFGSLEENFHEYAGLIYDGAYSEHMTNPERRGLTGDNIDEETAKNKVEEFISKDKIKKIESNGLTENANIQTYDFIITTINDEIIWVSISQKGGHIISMNYNRDVTTEILSQEDIDKIAQNFLEEKSFKNMKKTYFTKRDGIETINFAYEQDNVIVYPDLIR